MPKICKNCEAEFPYKVEIDGKIRNLGSRKYCLDCSPFGEHNTIQLHKQKETCVYCDRPVTGNQIKYCSKKCGQKSRYENRSLDDKVAAVVKCNRNIKTKSLIYKGGSCIVCGYNNCPAALDFHHIEEDEKEFTLSQTTRSWIETKNELDKCVLLCSNCHREHHFGDLDLTKYIHKNPTIKEGDENLEAEGFDPYFKYDDPNTCVDCEVEVQRTSTRCNDCYNPAKHFPADQFSSRKFDPSPEKLKELVWEMPVTKVGEHFGVSGNAIRKRCQKYNIKTPGRGYWQKKRAGKLD